jgi:membrane-associated phospholipid phosphatase
MPKDAENVVPPNTPTVRHRRRILWVTIMLVSMALYFLINRYVQGGVQLNLQLDQSIPLYPPFIIPYLMGTLLFIGLPVWSAIRVQSGEFEEYTFCVLLATAVSYITYLVFPTYVTRPEIVSQDLFSDAMNILYQADQVYNAAPSGHAFYSSLSFLYLSRWKPRYKPVWLAGWIIILASTLLTRQHNILDLLAGLFLAGVAYTVGGSVRKRWNLIFAS